MFEQIKKKNPLFLSEGNLAELKQSLVDIKKLNDEKKFLEEQENVLKEVAGQLGL